MFLIVDHVVFIVVVVVVVVFVAVVALAVVVDAAAAAAAGAEFDVVISADVAVVFSILLLFSFFL